MESMTTTTDPLSPARVEALEWTDGGRVSFCDDLQARETLAALARAHLDAAKRGPPAGLVEVITQVVNQQFPGKDDRLPNGELAGGIARAVEAFATTDEAFLRMTAAFHAPGRTYSEARVAAIRAALGVKEAGK